jgi:hypothetical protein
MQPAKWSLRLGAIGGQNLEATRGSAEQNRYVGDHMWRHPIGALERRLCNIIV